MVNLDLDEIPYLDGVDKKYALDSLTKVLTRQIILDIAQKLVQEKTPFTFMILDLDNFKQINDSFGHLAGDFILQNVGTGILDLCPKESYIGRYGGDEFLILLPNITDYDDVHSFLEKLYGKGKIFRKYYNDGTRDIYVTATLGCAKYPTDSTTFNELFNMADKALYRGKTKGRNCYIIYVESKHKDIVVEERAQGSLIKRFISIKRIFDIYKNRDEKIKNLMDFLYTDFHCTGASFILPDNRFISNLYSKPKSTTILIQPHLDLLLNGDSIFYDTPLTKYKQADKVFSEYVTKEGIQSIIVAKIKMLDNQYGYIVLYENSITRVWQESEIAIVMYAAALLELNY